MGDTAFCPKCKRPQNRFANPKDAHAWYNDGGALRRLCRFDELLKIDPRWRDTWIDKSLCLNDLDRFEEAVRCFDEALKIDSKN
jgi:tetratricopeptide (TPR) repeat protein